MTIKKLVVACGLVSLFEVFVLGCILVSAFGA